MGDGWEHFHEVANIKKLHKCQLSMWCLLVMVLGMTGGMEMEMEGDTGGGDVGTLEMDLDPDLLDQQAPSSIAGRGGGAR